MRLSLNRWLWIALCLNFATAIYAGISYRPLFWEGSHWLFSILDTGATFVDGRLGRFADTIPQFPTAFLTSRFPEIMTGSAPILVFSFSYVALPFILLCIAFLILRRHRRDHYLPMLLVSFALVTQMVAPSIQTIAAQTVGVFWVAFFLTLFQRKDSWPDLAAVSLAYIALLYCHESAIVGFLLFCGIGFLRARREAFSSLHSQSTALAAVCAALQVRRIFLASRLTGVFWRDTLLPWDSFRYFSLFGILATCLVMGWGHREWWKHRLRWIVYSFATASLVELGLASQMSDLLRPAHNSRGEAMPFSVLLALCLAWIELKGRGGESLHPRAQRSLRVIALIALASSALYDAECTVNWRKGITAFEAHVQSLGPGCYEVSVEEALNRWYPQEIQVDHLPILAMILERTTNPSKLLIVQWPVDPHPCQTFVKSRLMTMVPEWQLPLTCAGYFKCQPD